MKKVVLFILLLNSLTYSQTYPDLFDFPTAESVRENINGTDEINTLAKKNAALAILRQILLHNLKENYYKDESLRNKWEELLKIYGGKMQPYEKLGVGIKSKDEKLKIYKEYDYVFWEYIFDPSFRASIKIVLSEKALEHIRTLEDPAMYRKDELVKKSLPEATTSQTAADNKSTQQTTIFSFDENHQLTPNPIVFETPGLSAKELYVRTLKWVNKTYESTDDVIDSKIENDYIKIIGKEVLFPIFINFPYTIDIEFKNGRYRLTFQSVAIKDPKYFTKKYNLTESEAIKYNKNQMEGNTKAFEYIEYLYDSLNDYILQKNKKDGDW